MDANDVAQFSGPNDFERLKADYLNLVDVLTAERAHVEAHLRFLTGDPYLRWIALHTVRHEQLERSRKLALQLRFRPTLSLVMPALDPSTVQLRGAIDAIVAQTYDAWQLCVVLPERNRSAHRIVDGYAALDPRIERAIVSEPGYVAALNLGVARSTGEFVGIVDQDGLIAAHALARFAVELNVNPDADALYSDSDRIDEGGRRHGPHFKPGWSPDTLLSRAFVGRLALMRRTLVDTAGRFRPEFEGSHEWDLILRLADRTHRFVRIPDVLYHVRSQQTPQPAIDAAAIAQTIARRGEPGTVEATAHAGTFFVRYEVRGPARTTIIVPTRDGAEEVERCLRSVFERSTYRDFDVLLVDNGSTDPAALELFARLARDEPRLSVVRDDEPFNFSRLNNMAARLTTADYLIFLNNDTEVISPDWIEAMLGHAQRPTTGAVGALLLYPDDSVQHAGVVIGLGGCAAHSHKHAAASDAGYYGALAGVTNYSAVTAACLAIRREHFEAVGGFDERLAVAFNDVDLCLRLAARGRLNLYVPHARLYHFESKSRGADADSTRARRFAEEKRLLQQRWRIGEIEDPYYNPNLTLAREDFSIDA